MRSFTVGFWSFGHQAFDRVGRGAVWLVSRKAPLEEEMAYAVTGGALLSGILGAVTGFVLSDPSQPLNTLNLVVLGALLGVCMGMIVGSIVAIVDDLITDLLKSLNGK